MIVNSEAAFNMATTQHFSVIANSCVKPPVNPQTGLSVTLSERCANDMHQTWDGYVQDYDGKEGWQADEQGSATTSGVLNKTDIMMASLQADWGNISDAQFYARLQDLKSEHKKTLDICENLYTQKVGELRQSNEYSVGNTSRTSMTMGGNNIHDNTPNHQMFESMNNSYNSIKRRSGSPVSVRDNVKDMSRPPTGRSRPQSAKPSVRRGQECDHEHVQTCYSSDDEYWKPISAVTTDVELSRDEGCDHHHNHSHNDTLVSKYSAALSQVEDMWDNFSVEEYAPPKVRQRSSSLSRASSASSKRRSKTDDGIDTEDWRHRITLPKPFNMSVRESSKIKEKSQTLIEYEQKRAMERKEDEEECQKKFKARPVPAHVYMPLFDEKMEEMESKRQFQRENSKELLKSLEKPFNFMKREEEKKMHSRVKREKSVAEVKQKPPTGFKAKPFPVHLFDGNVMDRLQEEEEYRKIRVQMRAEELLKTASLPPNMASMGKDYIDGKSRQKVYAERAKKAGITVEHKFRPRINDTVPDFEEHHRQINNDLSNKKRTKEATVCKPFNLRTERIASKRHKVYEDIAKDAATLKSKTWSFNRSGSSKLSRMRSLSSSMDSIPTKMTASSQLRSSANRTKIQQELDAQLAELERERQQRIKEKKIKKYIAERVAMNDNTPDLERSLKVKIKEYKQSERERREEYSRMLNEIEERIEKRPLLFERALQANAKRTAERKYQDTLRRAGLDEDYIASKGKEATDADLDAVSDDDIVVSRQGSARSTSYRSRTASRSESRRYSDDYEDGNCTSDGSDIERD